MARSPTPGSHGPFGTPSSRTQISSGLVAAQPQHGPIGARVRATLVKASIGDSVRRHLHRRRQRCPAPLRDVHPDVDRGSVGPPPELLGSLPQRTHQAELVQRWRPEVVDDPPDVGKRGASVAAQ